MPNFRGEKIRVVKNRSHSSHDKYYETILWSNGDYTCNCRGWILPKNGNPRTCRHVKSMRDDLHGKEEHGISITKPKARSSGEILYRNGNGELYYDSKSWEEGQLYTPPTVVPKKYYRMIRVAK